MKSARVAVVILLFVICGQAARSAEPALERELARLGMLSGGTMGVAAVHLESGRSAWLNADESFPMASTYKVPIAARLLDMVDNGELSLSDRVDISIEEYSPGSGVIAKLLDDPGLSVSIHNLLEIMLLISDNTATDRLLDAVGGGNAVTAHMSSLGVEGIRVDRPTIRLIGDWLGIEDMPSAAGKRWDDYEELVEELPKGQREQAARDFEADPRDTSTPRGMATLLEKIWRGDALSKSSGELLIDIMERCETGTARLKGLLPDGTVVAHKTGTIGRTTNDVGVISLPDEAGHVIVVAFIKNSDLDGPDRERAIAEAARAAHDYFLFTR